MTSMNKETQMKGLVRIGYTVAALTVGLTVWLGYVNFLAIMNGVLWMDMVEIGGLALFFVTLALWGVILAGF